MRDMTTHLKDSPSLNVELNSIPPLEVNLDITTDLDVELSQVPPIEVDISDANVNLKVDINGEIYRGDYEVTPKVDEQVLDTADKFMTDNVVVHEIPVFEVSNSSGGNTIYIGSEVL